MSNFVIQTQTGNYLHVSYDVSKIFIKDNRFKTGTLQNNTGADATFEPGTLLARNATTGNLVPLLSTNTTLGQNIPVGVLANQVELVDGATQDDVPYCIGGDVAEEKLIFQTGDTLETVISDRRLKDRIEADTLGIVVMPGDERTAIDNV